MELIEVLQFGIRPLWEMANILRERLELHRKRFKNIQAETKETGIHVTGTPKQ